MAVKPCKECGKDVSTKADKCPNCGAPVSKPVGIGGILKWGFVLFLLYVVLKCSLEMGKSVNERANDTASPAAATSPPAWDPPLEVQSWKCETERKYTHVRGEVKNVSDRKLENVAAVGIGRNKAGDLVVSDDTLIDYNPLMPGQTSPFDVMIRHNPEIDKCELDFKNLLGGTIQFSYKLK